MLAKEYDATRTTSPEKYGRWARLVIGILMSIEAVLLFNACVVFAMFVLLMGGMAFLVGGGSASDANVTTAWQIIFLTALGPFLWPLLLIIGAINIFLRKRPLLIIISCAVSIIIDSGLLLAIYRHDSLDPENMGTSNSWSMLIVLAIIFLVIPLAGLVVAFQMKEN